MGATLGLYISIPFCRAKCTYCNFASGVFPSSDHAHYVERVCEELHNARIRAAKAGWDLPLVVGSIYLGGGTPSTLAPAHLLEIFAAVRQTFAIEVDSEITIECAPGQASEPFIEAMVEVLATRASLGVQSLVDAEAAATGRTHSWSTVEEDVRRLKAAGLSVNLDLIAGLPGQTTASWQTSLDRLCGMEPEHASLYMLEVDEDSRLGRELIGGGARYGAGLVPNDDTVAAMYEAGCAQLQQAGFAQYEISNFARPSAASRHNLRYWRREPYLGVGLDAHSMLRCLSGHNVARFGNPDDLGLYLSGDFEVLVEDVGRGAQLEEAWFLGLRLIEGTSLGRLRGEFGEMAVAAFDSVLAQVTDEGMLERRADRVALTMRGRMLSNEVFARLLDMEGAGSTVQRHALTPS